MSKTPRKNRQPKLKKVNVSAKAQWRQILKDVDKDEIPIDLLLSISVNLIDGTQININVRDLIDQGTDPKALERMLDEKFAALDDYIYDIDFMVSIDTVASRVQPITDQILKDL